MLQTVAATIEIPDVLIGESIWRNLPPCYPSPKAYRVWCMFIMISKLHTKWYDHQKVTVFRHFHALTLLFNKDEATNERQKLQDLLNGGTR